MIREAFSRADLATVLAMGQHKDEQSPDYIGPFSFRWRVGWPVVTIVQKNFVLSR